MFVAFLQLIEKTVPPSAVTVSSDEFSGLPSEDPSAVTQNRPMVVT
jgi:hypothetical protein